ncbi:MAG: PAS domain S-box protein [Alphaproteobacteria bacterium]|nr:PAS domain S-box protein [Alphaproteobacteria bacterium]
MAGTPPLPFDLVAELLATTESIVVVLDPAGRAVVFNRAAEKVSGRRAEEIVGRALWETVTAPEHAIRARERFRALGSGTADGLAMVD